MLLLCNPQCGGRWHYICHGGESNRHTSKMGTVVQQNKPIPNKAQGSQMLAGLEMIPKTHIDDQARRFDSTKQAGQSAKSESQLQLKTLDYEET